MKPADCQRMIDDLNKELDLLLYAISHDLRAPLRAIDGFSQAVLEDYGDTLDEEGRDYLARVRGGSRTINTYIEGLLSISRQSRGELVLEEANLSRIAQEAGKLVAARYRDHTPWFKVNDGMTRAMDRRLARFLFEKLLDNAWKFTEGLDEATIEVGQSELEHGEVACYVRDTGVGFDMNYAKDRLFGAFQRMHTEEEYPGLGVGLATAKRIVGRHGGRIWAESQPGEGTTVYFTVGEGAGEGHE